MNSHPSLWPTPATSPVSSESPGPCAEEQVGHLSAWAQVAGSVPGAPAQGPLWGRLAGRPPVPWLTAAQGL